MYALLFAIGDPTASEFNQWLGIAIAIVGLLVGIVTLAAVIFKAGAITSKVDHLDDAFSAHVLEDRQEFRKIESWHRNVVTAIARMHPDPDIVEKLKRGT